MRPKVKATDNTEVKFLVPQWGDIVDYGIAMMRDRNFTSIKSVLYRTTKGKNT